MSIRGRHDDTETTTFLLHSTSPSRKEKAPKNIAHQWNNNSQGGGVPTAHPRGNPVWSKYVAGHIVLWQSGLE